MVQLSGPCGSLLLLAILLPSCIAQEARPSNPLPSTGLTPFEFTELRFEIDVPQGARPFIPPEAIQFPDAAPVALEALQSVARVQAVVGVSFQNVGFVKRNGTQLSINGKRFFGAGTNAFYAGFKWIMSENEVFYMFYEHARRGATVMRIFAHSFFDYPEAMMPDFGVYNEDALRRLDLALAVAARNGIRLVMVLSNYWPFTGGVQKWVDRGLGTGKDRELFYTDSSLRTKFKAFVRKIVTRTNTYTLQKYTDDPTIMMWELMNEPRTRGRYEIDRGLPPGRIICNWVSDIAAYVKSLDKNHLVSVGDEGFRSNGPRTDLHQWVNNGYDGGSAECNWADPNVDIATIRTYPDAWGMRPPEGYKWLGPNYFRDRKLLADSLGKPIVYEEYGMVGQGYLSSRETLLDYFHEQANANSYVVTLIWAVSHYARDPTGFGGAGFLFGSNDGQGYVFGYDGPTADGSRELLEQYDYMDSRSNGQFTPEPYVPPDLPQPPEGCTDIPPPPGDFTCPQQRSFGKCNEPWMQGYCLFSCNRCPPAPAPPPGTCTDNPPPPGLYTCEEQKSFGKCEANFVEGYCLFTCGKCSPSCTDIPPPPGTFTCAEQRSFGKCNATWMQGYCLFSCERCPATPPAPPPGPPPPSPPPPSPPVSASCIVNATMMTTWRSSETEFRTAVNVVVTSKTTVRVPWRLTLTNSAWTGIASTWNLVETSLTNGRFVGTANQSWQDLVPNAGGINVGGTFVGSTASLSPNSAQVNGQTCTLVMS